MALRKGLIVAVTVLVWTGEATLAHEWYDQACCEERHCRAAYPAEIDITADGYAVSSPAPAPFEVVPYPDRRVKPSRDVNFHVCRLQPQAKIQCLYVPLGF